METVLTSSGVEAGPIGACISGTAHGNSTTQHERRTQQGDFESVSVPGRYIAEVQAHLSLEAPRLPYRKQAEEILNRWREAERAFESASESEAAALRVEITELKAAYQRLIAEAQVAQREEPPPFPSEP